jgi:hypothetical protein
MCNFCIPCAPPGNGQRPFLNDPPNAVYSSNFFAFNNFRTLMHDRNALNSFLFMHLRTTFIATEGWGRSILSTSYQSRVTSYFVSLCFQRLTHCPIDYRTKIVVLSERSESKDSHFTSAACAGSETANF